EYIKNKIAYINIIIQIGGKKKKHKKIKRSESNHNTLSRSESINSTKIIDFLNNSTLDVVQSDLEKIINNNDLCDTILGEGSMGKVSVNKIGSTYSIHYTNNLTVTLLTQPIAVKDGKIDAPIAYFIDPDKNALYVY